MERTSFQKVFYHGERLNDYINRGDTYPTHMIVGLTNRCNHACIWCYAADSISSHYNDNDFAPVDMVVRTITEAAALGLKAITFVGTGEPTLHPKFDVIARGIREAGVEIGLFTNGALLREGKKMEAVLDTHTFVRFSISGADREEHNFIHHAGKPTNDFDLIVKHIEQILAHRKEKGTRFPTVGVQFSVNHHDWKSVARACAFWKEKGVDYFAIKPVYKNENVEEHEENHAPYEFVIEEMRKCKAMETKDFIVYAKYAQFSRLLAEDRNAYRGYKYCHGQAFTTFFDPDGKLYVCGNLHGQDKFSIGNVLEQGSFKGVWDGPIRKQLLADLDVSKCPVGCRMDPLNLIIEDILNPDPEVHPNFL